MKHTLRCQAPLLALADIDGRGTQRRHFNDAARRVANHDGTMFHRAQVTSVTQRRDGQHACRIGCRILLKQWNDDSTTVICIRVRQDDLMVGIVIQRRKQGIETLPGRFIGQSHGVIGHHEER
ncbi:hypothetical protein D3C75_1024710 [compost metagenome]